jgi:hypothetical protein
MLRVLLAFVCSLYVVSLCPIAAAQMHVEVDAAHHKLEFQNDCVRVVRAIFGPHEKSTAFFDLKGLGVVIVEISGSERWQTNFPDGTSVAAPASPAGRAWWAPGGELIQPYKITDKRVEYLVIEPKGKGCH